jgi:CBS domain containing-hemolysin-like protein
LSDVETHAADGGIPPAADPQGVDLAELSAGLAAFFSFDPALLADPEMLARLLLQAILLIGSAFFSGSETALFSLSRLDLQQLARARHPNAGALHALLDQPRRLIISVLCGNELINIAAVANMTAILVHLYGLERAGVISILVMVPLLLLLGEITPKTIAVSNPVQVSAQIVARPMTLWVRVVAPLRWLIRSIADRITTWLVGAERSPEHILREDEFRSILDEVTREGELGATEHTLIRHLLDAGAREVVDIMTPRPRIAFIDAALPVPEAVTQFRALRHSRVPVYRGQRDNIIGFLRLERVLPLVTQQAALDELALEDLLDPAIVVPPTKKIQEMFAFFRDHSARAALVLNEFGTVEGMVTMRDVLTFIFGQLSGDVAGRDLYKERDNNVYELPGDMRLGDFNHLTNFGIHDPRMTTIGGVVFRHLDRLPKTGDQVNVDGVSLTVLEVKEQRITRLLAARGPLQKTDVTAQEQS